VFSIFLYLKAALYQQELTMILTLTLIRQQRTTGNFVKIYSSNFTHNRKAIQLVQLTDQNVTVI